MPTENHAAPRLMDQVRDEIRLRHYSIRTEHAYLGWIRRYILFHAKRHPKNMGAEEVTCFLTHLAVQGNVAASTQNQALNALLFLYRQVLKVELPWLNELQRAKKPARLPVVLTRDEVRNVLAHLDGTNGAFSASLVCHPPSGRRLRHSHCSGASGPSGRQHHHDLYPCPAEGWSRRAQPAGYAAKRREAATAASRSAARSA